MKYIYSIIICFCASICSLGQEDTTFPGQIFIEFLLESSPYDGLYIGIYYDSNTYEQEAQNIYQMIVKAEEEGYAVHAEFLTNSTIDSFNGSLVFILSDDINTLDTSVSYSLLSFRWLICGTSYIFNQYMQYDNNIVFCAFESKQPTYWYINMSVMDTYGWALTERQWKKYERYIQFFE